MCLVNSQLVRALLLEQVEPEELQAEELRCPPSLLKTITITFLIKKRQFPFSLSFMFKRKTSQPSASKSRIQVPESHFCIGTYI